MAAVAAARGDWARAATLIGAAGPVRVFVGAAATPVEEAELASIAAASRAALGHAAYEAARQAGAPLDVDRAVELALAAVP
jgi:hypothetical protein